MSVVKPHGEFLQQSYICTSDVKPNRENQKFVNSDEKTSRGLVVKLFGAKAWRQKIVKKFFARNFFKIEIHRCWQIYTLD
jgi:hypothetical protein